MPDSTPAADIASLRHQYGLRGLSEGDVAGDPFTQLRAWIDAAVTAEVPEPAAMTLATADGRGRPSARTVLLRGLDERGLVFFTSHRSRKGRELAENPHVACVLCWAGLQRQVTATGRARPVDDAESDAYFASRPRGSQLGAWASEQSTVISDRGVLERHVVQVTTRFDGVQVPRPPDWGGFRIEPAEVEFWQGRPDRLHDRLRYRRPLDVASAVWSVERLAP